MRIICKALWGCLLMVCFKSGAQTLIPSVQVQIFFGGYGGDGGRSITEVNDGSRVILGHNGSLNGNISCPTYNWVFIKLDSFGNVIWQRCSEYSFSKIKSTSDGGFIAIGTTTNNSLPDYHGADDVLLTKFDANGMVEWRKVYGGTNTDFGENIVQVAGGYTFIAETKSNNGDVLQNYGSSDIWVVNIDNSGNILWQKSYGSSAQEYAPQVIEQIADGGYVYTANRIAGTDTSAIVLKLTAAGAVIWERTYYKVNAGSNIKPTPDGGFVFVGIGGRSLFDERTWGVYILRLNTDGSEKWRAVYEMRHPSISGLIIDKDGGFIIAGSYQPAIRDWLGGYANTDGLIMKIADENGGPMEWAKAYGGSSWEYISDMALSSNGDLLLVGTNNSNAGPQGDIWYMQMRNFYNIVKGRAFIDANLNSLRDAGEPDANNFTVKSELVNSMWFFVPTYESLTKNGRFKNAAEKGTVKTTIKLKNGYYNAVPALHESLFNAYEQKDSVDFALQPVGNVRDYNVSIIPLNRANAFRPAQYVLKVHNAGTDILINKELVFIKDRMSLLSANIPPASITGDTLRWTIPLLNPTDTAGIYLDMKLDLPPSLMTGDMLLLKASIDSAGDVSSPDNFFTLKQIVVGSFDPNDKAESSGEYLTRAEVRTAKTLNYTIRFQNTGTDTAYNVWIQDNLDSKLNIESFEVTGASHRFSYNIITGNQLTFYFGNILLPDSNVNERASHGYISYRIRVKTNLVPGDEIKNTASIFFDFNDAVQTNTCRTIVVDNNALPVQLGMFQGVRNKDIVNLVWSAVSSPGSRFDVERSINGIDFEKLGSVDASANNTSYAFDDKSPKHGLNYYRLKMISPNGTFSYSRVITIEFIKYSEPHLTIYPNPAPGGKMFIKIEGALNDVCKINVLDVNGKLVASRNLGSITATYSYTTQLHLGKFQRGVYVIRLTVGQKIITRKVTIM
ncbi:MAG: T9SS type A sorting domain-containing protein [Chitinophagaceae bacterium]